MAETAGQRKALGIVWVLAAIVGVGLAFVVQPFGEWGLFATVLAILLVILGATGLWVAIGSMFLTGIVATRDTA